MNGTQNNNSNNVNQNNNINNQSNNISPEVITPVIDVKEINTKKSSSSNLFFFIIIFLVIGVVVFSDKILNFITDNEYNVVNKNTATSSNLINGYIKINDSDNFMINNNIKFYNFRTSSNNILFNYMSSKDISNVSKLNIYIELYNSSEELIDLIKFDVSEKLESDMVTSYNIGVDSYIYKNAYYAKVKVYTDVFDKSLVCTYNIKDSNINIQYKITYNFDYFDLRSYQVDKNIEYNLETEEAKKYVSELKNEYDNLVKFNINSNYTENNLSYAIDLNTINKEFKTIYNKGDNYYYIKNSEELKKWICN